MLNQEELVEDKAVLDAPRARCLVVELIKVVLLEMVEEALVTQR